MKNIKTNLLNSLIVISLLLVPLACEEYLEEDLRDALSPATFYNNDNEAEIAVNGAYALLTHNNFYKSRDWTMWMQMGTDESSASRNIFPEGHNYTYGEGVRDGEALWNVLYEIVRNTSSAITNMDGNANLSQTIQDQSVGQMLMIRALAYYELTRIWGDVPYFRELLAPAELAELTRTPINTIRTDMKADLERAYSLLPSTYSGSENQGRFTKWAAMSLKAKYHLFDNEWAETLAACLDVINNSPHTLMANFEDVYNWRGTTPASPAKAEHILWIDFAGISGNGVVGSPLARSNQMYEEFNPRLRDEPLNKGEKNALKAALAANGDALTGYGARVPLPDLADQANWQAGDLRYDATITQSYEGIALKFPYFNKLWNLNQSSTIRGDRHENFVMIRLADIYLMAAEAQNEISGPDNAYQYVNKIRERAFEPDQPLSGMTQESFRLAIRDERKFELCGENHRKQDLIRWGILIETVQNTTHRKHNTVAKTNIKPHHVKAPIPLAEILRNPKLLETDPTNNGYR